MAICPKCGAQNPDDANYCNKCSTLLERPVAVQNQSTGPPSLPPSLQPGQKATLLDYLRHYKGLQIHWAKRFVALVLDAIFVVAPAYVLVSIMSWTMSWEWFVVTGGIVLFLYSAIFEDAFGWTIGKAIVSLRVVSVQGRLTLFPVLIRNITKVFAIVLLLEFVVSLFMQTTDAHQRFMDKLAMTTVVEKKA